MQFGHGYNYWINKRIPGCVGTERLEGVVGKPVGVRVPPSAPVEIRRRSETLGAFFISTGALPGLEPARAPTSRRKSATSGARQPDAAPQRPMAWTAEANAGESPLRHQVNNQRDFC